jgi:hypothetical protein
MLAASLLVAGCASGSAGGRAGASAAPAMLGCEGEGSALTRSFPAAWVRGVLVIDLTGLTGDGECSMRAVGAGGWPERLALRVVPGVTPALEVVADQRLRLPVAGAGGASVELMLPHALHSPATPRIGLRWGAAAGVAAVSGIP